ncbi:MAG: hypothetical protein V2A72_08825 [Candidatus Omnitrophota bacterium]
MVKLKPYSKHDDNRTQRSRGNVNVDFFKTWSSQMAYVLGYFCADGCISYGHYSRRNRKSKVLLITVKFASSSENFLVEIKDRLACFALLKGGCITKGDGCKYLVYSRNDSGRLFGYLYDKIGDDIYLKRKYNKFLKVFNN